MICPPFVGEYLRSHRALRVLGDRLSEAGLDVLRFDWYGTGDSGGEHRDLTLEGAVADVRTAVEEGLSLAGAREYGVVLVGHRHGTLPAALAAVDDDRIGGLVLWDPVSPSDISHAWRQYPPTRAPGARWVGGFAVSDSLLQELEAADRGIWEVTDHLPSLTVKTAAPIPEALRRRADDDAWPGTVEVFPGPGVWEETTDLGAGTVPGPLLAAITRWCS